MSSFIKAVPLSQLSKYSSADDQIVLLSSTDEQPGDAAEMTAALGLGTAATAAATDFASSADTDDRLIGGREQPLTLPSHDGSVTATHPSPVDRGTRWNGYRYWLAYTPWPSSAREFPNVVASNNMVDWVAPTGNPQIATQAEATAAGYASMSDTDLVVMPSGNLACYYRMMTTTTEAIYRKTSSDGVTWSSGVLCLAFSGSGTAEVALSPAVVVETGGTYSMWTVNTSVGGTPENQRIEKRTSADGITWSAATVCTMPLGGLLAPWHVSVRLVAGTYHMLVNARSTLPELPLVYLTSTDGTTWTGDVNQAAIPRSGLAYDEYGYYRSSMIPANADGTLWHVFSAGLPIGYSTNGSTGNWWRIGLRKNVRLGPPDKEPEIYYGKKGNGLAFQFKRRGGALSSGTSFDLTPGDDRLVEGSVLGQGILTIWGNTGSTNPVGGIWIGYYSEASQISTGIATTTRYRGPNTPTFTLSAAPDNVTPVVGDSIVGNTSATACKLHSLNTTTQWSVRDFSTAAVFTSGEQIKINGVIATNGGTPVTLTSAGSGMPAFDAINVLYIKTNGAYKGRFQVHNCTYRNAWVGVSFESVQ